MIHQNDRNFDMAKYYYKLEEDLSLSVTDDQSLGRALVGLSVIARHDGDLDGGIRLALQAEEAFRRQANKLGVAASDVNLANLFLQKQDFSKSLYYSQQALSTFIAVRDLRGAGNALALLGKASEQLRNYDDEVYYLQAAHRILEKLGFERIADGQLDLRNYESSLNELRQQLGSDRFDTMARSAELRINDLFEQLGLEIRAGAN
jgi:hypothetical protein